MYCHHLLLLESAVYSERLRGYECDTARKNNRASVRLKPLERPRKSAALGRGRRGSLPATESTFGGLPVTVQPGPHAIAAITGLGAAHQNAGSPMAPHDGGRPAQQTTRRAALEFTLRHPRRPPPRDRPGN